MKKTNVDDDWKKKFKFRITVKENKKVKSFFTSPTMIEVYVLIWVGFAVLAYLIVGQTYNYFKEFGFFSWMTIQGVMLSLLFIVLLSLTLYKFIFSKEGD